MPQFPSWWRQVSALILIGLTIVVPLSGYFTRTHATLVMVGLLAAFLLITLPPVFQWLIPPIKVEVARPPAADALRGLKKQLEKRLHRRAPHVMVAPEQEWEVRPVAGQSGMTVRVMARDALEAAEKALPMYGDDPDLEAFVYPALLPVGWHGGDPHDVDVALNPRWLPNPADLASFAMTNVDLDVACNLAVGRLQQDLAPDAIIEFQRIVVPVVPANRSYGYPPQVDFRGWSDTADRGQVVSVTELGEVFNQIPIAEKWALPDWGLAIRPWATDDTWPDLVRNSWYRARWFTGHGVLTYGSKPMPDGEGWGQWSMCYVREGEGPEVPPQCFRLRNGRLEPDPLGRTEPFHWG